MGRKKKLYDEFVEIPEDLLNKLKKSSLMYVSGRLGIGITAMRSILNVGETTKENLEKLRVYFNYN